jgi:hypothetical protein
MQVECLDIEIAFFWGDHLLCRGAITCVPEEMKQTFEGAEHVFQVTHAFERPACRVLISATRVGEHVFRSAMRVGVHTSDDLEAINPGGGHSLAFKCAETRLSSSTP